MKKIISIIIILTISISFLYSQQAKETKSEQQVEKVELNWPFDKYSGFENYAQELVFYRDKGYEYLEQARKYYIEGYNLIKRYQLRPEIYDLYLRDPYRVEVGSPTDLSMRMDFALAEVYFTRALDISARYMDWDTKIKNEPLYKSLLENCFKNVIYTSVYNGNYYRALKYLNEYKKFQPDEKFINEWEARIMGNLVKLHEKYDWVFVGKYSAENMKREHRELLNRIIEKNYSNDPEFMKELKNRIYPEYVVVEEKEEKSEPAKEQGK
jgi:hypothetical protein